MTTQTHQNAQAQKLGAAAQSQKLVAAEQAIVERRNSNLRQATADQQACLLDTLVDFRLVFPTVAEVTAIVTSNGGMKSTGKETQNTTLLIYIAMLGADTFNALYDNAPISKADYDGLTPNEVAQKRAKHAQAVYRAMLVVDKHAAHIAATAKFTRTPTNA